MAKNSRERIRAAGAVLILALPTFGALAGSATAAGLPLRGGIIPAQERALAGLAEGLDFKLGRVERAGPTAWAAMVDETLLIARRLGWSGEAVVTPYRFADTYAVVLQGDAFVAGTDADRVLGRLLFVLAHDVHAASTSAALAVLDQPLSATLKVLPLVSTP